MRLNNTTVALAAIAILCSTTVAGCAEAVRGEEKADPCGWLREEPKKAETNAGQTAILVDVSNSTRAKDGKGSLDYHTVLDDEISDAVKEGDVVSIGAFDGSAATVQWIADELITNRGSGNDGNKEDDRITAVECLGKEVEHAMAARARNPGSDILGAIDMAGEKLAARGGARRIVVATDGLATVGCANLTKVDIGTADVAERLSQQCKQRPHPDLSKTKIVLLGVGIPATGQPVPSSGQLYSVAGVWERLCADLAGADNCTVPLTSIKPSDNGPAADPEVTDPVVPFPTEKSQTYELQFETLFTPNSFQISGAGQQRIADVANEIKASGAVRVVVHGYTEAQASPADNLWLAQHRADAVRAQLVKQGVTVVLTQAHPGTAPQCGPARRDGQQDEITRQCKRRVDIVATTTA
jgi:OOP family OmpA-OmpF porin